LQIKSIVDGWMVGIYSPRAEVGMRVQDGRGRSVAL
jgi:hypothetical protein